MKKAFITGARGFVGRNLIDELRERGIPYVRFDSVDGWKLDNLKALKDMMAGCDHVFHLAGNADIRNGWNQPRVDLDTNLIGTVNVLEAMWCSGINDITYASSSGVYGDMVHPTEDDFLKPQTSLYGASKVGAEAFIQAYTEGRKFNSLICRFTPVLGRYYRHGYVYDFVHQLLEHPEYLVVRGDGTTRKAFIYARDVTGAMMHLIEHGHSGIYNITTPESCTINQGIEWICEYMELKPNIAYTGGQKGWIGDSHALLPRHDKLYDTGWKMSKCIRNAMREAVESIIEDFKHENKEL